VIEECIIEFLLDYYFLVEVFLVELGFVFELVFAHGAGRPRGRIERRGGVTAEPARCFPTMVPARRFGCTARPGARSITPPTGAAVTFRADGSRRSVGPLGGPSCTRQTGYRSALYLCSWTCARPP